MNYPGLNSILRKLSALGFLPPGFRLRFQTGDTLASNVLPPRPGDAWASSPAAATKFDELRQRVEDEFRSSFGYEPTVIAAAPGRVNLIGEHIDYNDGFVLPMAIQRYVIIAAALRGDTSFADSQTANFYSSDLQESIEVPLAESTAPTLSNWGRYVEGIVSGFMGCEYSVPPFNAVIGSNVPVGGGLSSSAALEVATATMIEGLTNHQLDPAAKALLCQRAEHEFAGVPCGIMDQFSSVFGKPDELMLLDCRRQTIKPVPFDDENVSVLIVNSNVEHELAGGQYAQRREQCESALKAIGKSSWRNVLPENLEQARTSLSENQYACGRHVVTEIERTLEAAAAFESEQWERVGELMYASHESLQHDYRVSCSELDILVRIARQLGVAGGVFGSRMTGGGFGGCTVTLLRTDSIDSVSRKILSRYKSETGISATVFASRPAIGAHLVQRKSNEA